MTRAGTVGRKIGHGMLAAGAALVVLALSLLGLLFTLICAPPLKAMAERLRDQAP
jgi:hypothetical protein